MTRAVAEMRTHSRVSLAPTVVRARVEHDADPQEGYLVNLSLGGAFLAMEGPPDVEESCDLHLLLPWGIGECRLDAKVAWQQHDGEERTIGAGMSFVDVSDDARGKLQSYLDRFAELSAEITD